MNRQLKIHYFQHVPFEGLGCIEDWIIKNGHHLSFTHFFDDAKLPSLPDIDWLIVMGGPMGIYDDQLYPWLPAEKQFIRTAIDSNKVVLGICLGAQLLADTLGAKVEKGEYEEIGWYPVSKTNEGRKSPLLADVPDQTTVFHWHGDQFQIPSNSFRLAESKVCPNQILQFGDRVLGLQFHLEATRDSIQEMISHIPQELKKAGSYIQSETEIREGCSACESNNQLMFSILNRLATIL